MNKAKSIIRALPMLKWLQKPRKVLRVQFVGPNGELFSDQKLLGGSYKFTRLHENAPAIESAWWKIFEWRMFDSSPFIRPFIQLQFSEEKGFGISTPMDCKIFQRDVSIHNQSGDGQISLSWPSLPELITVQFLNGARLKFFSDEEINTSFLKRGQIAFALALFINLLVVSAMLIRTPVKPRLQTTEVRVVQSLESSNQVKAAENHVRDDAVSRQMERVKETQSLFQSMGNKTKKSVSFPTASSKSNTAAFQSGQTSKNLKNAWSFDIDDELQKDLPKLNMTESEVAKALGNVSGYLKDCYQDVLIKDQSLKGAPVMRIGVSSHGRIENLEFSEVGAKSTSLAVLKRCFLSAFRNVRFPRVPNREFEINQTLVLNQ